MCRYTATITITAEQAKILSIGSADDLVELLLERVDDACFWQGDATIRKGDTYERLYKTIQGR